MTPSSSLNGRLSRFSRSDTFTSSTKTTWRISARSPTRKEKIGRPVCHQEGGWRGGQDRSRGDPTGSRRRQGGVRGSSTGAGCCEPEIPRGIANASGVLKQRIHDLPHVWRALRKMALCRRKGQPIGCGTFSRESKLSAVKLVQQQGYVVAEAAKSLGIGPGGLATWPVQTILARRLQRGQSRGQAARALQAE